MIEQEPPSKLSFTQKAIEKVLSLSAGATSAYAGAAIGTVIAGPIGGAVGGSVGWVIESVAEEISNRMVSHREKHRMDTVIGLACVKIQQRLNNGEYLRGDGFFPTDVSARSDAYEVMEGIVLKARDTYQEKKLPYLANLMASVAFRPDISSTLANHIIKISDSLSYRQFCLLSIAGRSEFVQLRHVLSQPHDHDMDMESLRLDIIAMMQELFDNRSDFGVDDEDKFKLMSLGELTYQLLGLSELPREERQAIKLQFEQFQVRRASYAASR